MSTYRLYFRDGRHWTCGRQDFEAVTKSEAICIARELADACSDVCRSFELWNGRKLVCEPPDIGDVYPLDERHEEIAIRTEEMIRWSYWRIAQSQRLIERLDAATAKRRDRGLV
jgi:hypothetical protein